MFQNIEDITVNQIFKVIKKGADITFETSGEIEPAPKIASLLDDATKNNFDDIETLGNAESDYKMPSEWPKKTQNAFDNIKTKPSEFD